MSKLLRVYNPFSPSEVLHEYAPTSAAELDALLRTSFTPGTREQLRTFAATVTSADVAEHLVDSFAWSLPYAMSDLSRVRGVLEWYVEHVVPGGYPLGCGVIVPNETDPLAALVHMFAALLTGNRVVLIPTPQAAAFATQVMELAQQAALPVYAAHMLSPERLSHPEIAFVTWWDDSFAGYELARELTDIAPGQLFPRRLWGQFDGNGVAIVCDNADVPRAARDIAQFAFSPVATTSFGIERVVVHDAVHDSFIAELNAAAEAWREFTPATTKLAERFAQFRQLAHIEGRVVRDYDDSVIVTDIPRSASTACEVVRGPLLTVQRGRTLEELLELAGGGLYGSVVAVFGGTPEFVEHVAAANIAGTVFHNEMRHAAPGEAAPVLKLSGIQAFPLGPELHRNYERTITFLPNK